MKKALAVLLTAILVISVISGCAKSESKPNANSDKKSAANTEVKKVKVRLMAYNQESIRKSYLEFLKGASEY